MIAPAAEGKLCGAVQHDLGLLTQCPCKHMQPEALVVAALKSFIYNIKLVLKTPRLLYQHAHALALK